MTEYRHLAKGLKQVKQLQLSNYQQYNLKEHKLQANNYERKNGDMMKSSGRCVYTRAIILVGILLCSLHSFAQTPSLAALKNRLNKTKADTARIAALLQLSNYYSSQPKPALAAINNALYYGSQAQKLGITLACPKGLGNSYMALAKAFRFKKDSAACNGNVRKAIATFLKYQFYHDAAEAYLKLEEYYQAFGGRDFNVRIAFYEQANVLFERVAANDRQEATLKILGDFYQVQGNYPKALQRLEQALTLIKYVNLADRQTLYDLLGTVYAMTGNFNKALQYGLLAVKITELAKDTGMQACAVYNRVGITYYNMKQFPRARVYYEKALNIALKYRDTQTIVNQYINIGGVLIASGRFEECITLLKRVDKQYAAKGIPNQSGLIFCILKSYVRLNKLAEAKFYCDKLEAASDMNDPYGNYQQIIQSILTEYYVATVQDKPARKHLAFLKKLSAQQHNPVAMAIAYVHGARLDSAEGNYASAFKNYRISGIIRDSIYNEASSKQIAQLQIQFETEKKDQQLKVKQDRINLLNNQARLQQINLKQEKTTQKLIVGGALLLAVLLIISYAGYRAKKKVNGQLQAQRAEIEQKNLSLTQLVTEKDGLLQEKEWLMKEIHHRVKNNLQIVISLLSTQSNYLDNDIAYNAIRESQHRMQSISLIHQKLYQSDNLALVDINSYIADLVVYLRDSFDTGNRIDFEMDIAHAELDVTRSVPLGLILNEAITNSIKYAFPNNRKGKISISLKPSGINSFTLRIQDNGVGLPPAFDITKSRSLGMSLMRGLSKQLGGTLKIEGGNGMAIIIELIDEKLLKAV